MQLCTRAPLMVPSFGSAMGYTAACCMASLSACCQSAEAADSLEALSAWSISELSLASLKNPKFDEFGGRKLPSRVGTNQDFEPFGNQSGPHPASAMSQAPDLAGPPGFRYLP